MAKIKIFFTGGTIGSRAEDGVTDLSDTRAISYKLLDNVPKNARTVFETETIYNVLSENTGMFHWEKLYRRVCDGLGGCDGVIITHGTDTLAYTAPFLAFTLRHAEVPVLLVSSNYPLDDARTNGFENFRAAVDFILKTKLRGVYVPFSGNGETVIHLGARLVQPQAFHHGFSSLRGVWFGRFKGGRFHRNPDPRNPTFEDVSRPATPLPAFRSGQDVMCIMPYPGIDYGLFDLARRARAVLHGLYHSGTANADVAEFAQRCAEKGVDFYAAPFDSDYATYRSAVDIRTSGVEFLSGMTFEAAYAKLVVAYGAFDDDAERSQFLWETTAFERQLTADN
ncbi:MAG: asparaginase [Oscillospiraceae bacterium]|jgi:L-asparaginase|nr:asparaginase [Oscillospiraceae bacterium]